MRQGQEMHAQQLWWDLGTDNLKQLLDTWSPGSIPRSRAKESQIPWVKLLIPSDLLDKNRCFNRV